MEKKVKDLVISVVRGLNAELPKSEGTHVSLISRFADDILDYAFLNGFVKNRFKSDTYNWVRKHAIAILSIPAFILDKEEEFQYDYLFTGIEKKEIEGFVLNIHWVIAKWLFYQKDLVKTIAEKLRLEKEDVFFPMTEENIEVIQNTLIQYVKERNNYPTIC